VKTKHKPKKDLCVHVLVLSGDGFKSSSCLDDEDSEDAFCGDIHDGVQASFHGGRNHSLTFSNDPDNWVKSPKNNGHPCDFVVKSTCFFSVFVNFAVLHEDSADVDEGDHAEDEEKPLVLVRSLCTGASEANHQHVHDENHSDLVIGGSSKSKNVPKHERGGEDPVNISSPVDGGESSGDFFDPHASSSGEHKQISKGSNSGDSHGENFEEFAARDGLCPHVKVQSRKRHADETDEEAPVSEVAKVILHWVGVFLNAVNRTQVCSPLRSNGRVKEFFNSAFDVVKVRGSDDDGSGLRVFSKGFARDNESLFGLENVLSRNVSFSEGADCKKRN